uniref:Uncharacterized protein n=1 Tax=Anguilla anguilla TaxID=7936 RepID=A0A0E9SVW1_ANGAN
MEEVDGRTCGFFLYLCIILSHGQLLCLRRVTQTARTLFIDTYTWN